MIFWHNDKRKLITTLAVLLLVGFAATTLVNYYVSKGVIRDSIIASELPLTSDNLYSEIQKDLVRPVLIASMMASNTFLRDWVTNGEAEPARIVKYLREIKQRNGTFTSFFISERTRIYYQAEGVLKKVREDEPRDAWYFRVRGMDAPYEISFDPDLANKDKLTTFINFRVHDDAGNYLGVAGVGLAVDTIRGLINKYQQRYLCNVYFFDQKTGALLFGSDALVAGTKISSIEGLGGLAERIKQEGAGNYQYDSGGRNHLLNVRLVPELKWYLFVERVEEDALTGIRRTLYLNLAICVVISLIVLFATSLTINRYQGQLEVMATTDKLTGLANRQACDLLIPQALAEARRAKAPLLAMMIDIDHFKYVNDRLGHPAGDSMLTQLAQAMKGALRESDIVCRWGGEEFLVVIKDTDAAPGQALAEKIRGTVENGSFRWQDEPVRVTVSVGVAYYKEGETPEQLIARADKALFQAKDAGRNRVHVAA
ncbi:MAG: sensor domain-containing diguanylate cyclase [Betaproteobacteria bacterium]|nr:sensor domain-containing diguanylate cyclase [Betaproteobacteria bacterium]